MFLAIDGDITAAEARFLGRLAGLDSVRGEERRRRDGKRKGGLGMGGGLAVRVGG